ncbi:MAG: TetR/AcrR family transcriptional regulator [Acidimicrobiales bacterium]
MAARGRPTQSERRAATRTRLLGAATELFAEHGIDGVSVDAVAAAAGRTSGAVYDHFGSKHGLLIALLDDWSGALVAVMSAEFEISTDMYERLGAVWDNVCADPSEGVRRLFLLEHELWLRAARDTRLASALRDRTRASNERIARGIARWQSQGRLVDGSSPDMISVLLKSMVIGLHMQMQADPDSVDRHAAIAALALIVGAPASESGIARHPRGVPAAFPLGQQVNTRAP